MKYAWAKHHLKNLKQTAGAFEKSEAATVTAHFKPKRAGYDLRFHILRPVPIVISPQIGDVVGCLRDALDHLIYELTDAHSGTVTVGHKPAFPVCEYRSQWPMAQKGGINKRSGEWKVHRIPPKAQAVVKRLQPFYGKHRNGPFRQPNPLWVLDELRNIDRHRRLALTALGITHGKTMVTPAHLVVRTVPARYAPKDGAPIQRIWLAPGTTEAQVRVDPNFAFALGLNEPSVSKRLIQVVPSLESACEWVRALLDEFLQFRPKVTQEDLAARLRAE